MTYHALEQLITDLVTQLSTQGFENPLSFAAIERTGRTSSGSSLPTQAGWIEPMPVRWASMMPHGADLRPAELW